MKVAKFQNDRHKASINAFYYVRKPALVRHLPSVGLRGKDTKNITTGEFFLMIINGRKDATAPLPVAIGVIRNVKKTSYTQLYEDQMEEQMANGKYKCVDDLLNSGDTWEI